MNIQQAIQYILDGKDLESSQMQQVMHAVMSGECTTPAQIAGFLIGLRMKGESVEEITAAAEVMRDLSNKVNVSKEHLIDTCGTGGDSANTFNISTTSAFAAAAAGARVAKHGNRSVSSKSGSADVLEAAGVKLDLSADQVAECINLIGIGFMFAPMYHGAMKHALGPRKELGVRTIFNLLGPLTNPAGAPNQVLGVFSNEWLEKLIKVQQKLGAKHVMVVHSEDGMDEISISAPTRIAELVNGEIREYTVSPEQFEIKRNDLSTLAVQSISDSLNMMLGVLENKAGPAMDIVLLNAGAAIYTAGIADSLEAAVAQARHVIEDGSARAKLDQLVKLTNSF